MLDEVNYLSRGYPNCFPIGYPPMFSAQFLLKMSAAIHNDKNYPENSRKQGVILILGVKTCEADFKRNGAENKGGQPIEMVSR